MPMSRARFAAIAAAAMIGCVAQSQAANLITNGEFESSGVTLNNAQCSLAGGNTVAGWKNFAGNNCYIATGYGAGTWPAAHGGIASMFVNNNVQFGAAVGQSVNLTAGTTYTLNFYLAGLNGYGQASVNVDIGGFHQSFTNTHSIVSDWVLQTMQFTATSTGASNLVFTSAGGAVELDDVSLTDGAAVTHPAPEPASLALVLLALGASGAAARARRR